ncbi:Syntaxin-5 [Chamberlinius hualienensis]
MSARRRRVGSESESREFPYSTPDRPTTYSQTTDNRLNYSSVSSPNTSSKDIHSTDADMTCRDRTNEFMSAVKLIQHGGRMTNGAVGYQPGKAKYDTRQWNDFMTIAKSIGRDIGNTYTKLEKLTLLAKRNSLFDDRPVDIEELTYIIKQDIGSLNKQIAQLQTLVKSQQNANGSHMQTHSSSVVVSLQSKLASMSNDFKKVLEVRTENLKLQKNRRDQFTQGAVTSSLPPSAIAGYHQGSVLMADDKASGRNDYSINMGSDLVPSSYYQQQQLLVDEQDSYLQNRAETMQNIESTIVELGGIFQQLAFMVKEQEEMIQRIDSNVEDTTMNVEAAHTEIVKYFRSVTSNRWLMIKIFAVLLFFFIIFIVFMA